MVVRKLIDPKIELTPAKCSLRMAISTDTPEWNFTSERGGYTVHPVPAPESTKEDSSSIEKDGINNQNDKLFIRGNTISTAPSIIGISQLPNPPIAIGITMKKIIIKA